MTRTWMWFRGPVFLAFLASIGIFIVDLLTPLGIAISILYVVPVLISFWVPRRRFPVVVATGSTVLTVIGLLASPSGSLWLGAVNRILALALIWGTILIVVRYRGMTEALVTRTQHAQEYLDIAGVMLLALDREGRVALINRRGCEILGYREAELLGRNWFQTCVPDRLRADVETAFRQIVAGNLAQLEYYENPVVTRGGEERIVAWHNTVLHDAAGNVTGTLSSGEDVTARQQGEQALQRSLKDLADIKFALDQSAIVATTDTRGLITYVNDKFCEIAKYPREELLGQDHRIINSRYHPKEFMRNLWFTIASGRIWRGEIRNRAKDGSYYWVDTTIVPFLDSSGKPYQYTAIRYDITERKRAEAKLQEQATLARLGEMAAVVAHEVKNPIAGIRGALQIVGARMPADNRDRAVIGDIVARLDALNELVQDLLLFARPRPLKATEVAMKALVETTASLMARDPTAAGTRVRYEGDTPVIEADEEQLQRVFLNLFLNAAQAMGEGGHIDVSVALCNGRCDIAVRDHGPGIPAEVRERLFQPFVTTKHRGTGLGLAIARRIVELHGGTIDVAVPSDEGAVFKLSLPARQ